MSGLDICGIDAVKPSVGISVRKIHCGWSFSLLLSWDLTVSFVSVCPVEGRHTFLCVLEAP